VLFTIHLKLETKQELKKIVMLIAKKYNGSFISLFDERFVKMGQVPQRMISEH